LFETLEKVAIFFSINKRVLPCFISGYWAEELQQIEQWVAFSPELTTAKDQGYWDYPGSK
jgi:elongation factor P hydroxylase